MKRLKVIYFIKSNVPAMEEQLEAESMNANVVFRNARLISNTGCIEECDAVAGEIPESYKDLPKANAAISAFEKARVEEIKKRAAAAKKEKPAEKPVEKGAEKPAKMPEASAVGWKAN